MMSLDRTWLFLIWVSLTCLNASAECPTQTLSIFISSETFPILNALNATFLQVQKLDLNVKNVPFIALSKNKDLMIPGWDNPKSINMYNVATKSTRVFEQSTEDFAELAVDQSTGNVYYIAGHNNIGVCVLDKKKCITLVNPPLDSRAERTNLCLDSKKGALYWVNDYIESSIHMAGMDGSDPRTFLSHTGKIYGIALDLDHDLLFVAGETSIDSVSLISKQRETILDNTEAADLHYSGCKLIFKLRGSSTEFIVYDLLRNFASPISRIFGHRLHVATESTAKYVNPCASVSCKEVCVLAEGGTARCVNNETAIPEAMPVESNFEVNWNYVGLCIVGVLFLISIIAFLLSRCTYTKILSEFRACQSLRTPTSTLPEYTVRYSNVNNNEDRSLL